jgi:hypothetical protein
MTEQLDTQGEAREALSSMVNDYSKRILNDPRMLGNLVTDLLPDLPRERSLLVTAAESDVAGDLTRHVEEHHLDPDTAVQLVARSLTDRRALDPAASAWVTTEYAQALGYQVRSGPPPMPQPMSQPPAQDTLSSYGQYGPPQQQTAPPQNQPPLYGSSYPGYSQPPAYPPGGQPTAGPAQQGPPPPWQPPGPPSPRKPNRWPMFAAIGAAAVVVIVVVALAATGTFSGKSKPDANSLTTHPPTSHPPTPTPSPTYTVASLTELLPGDLDDPASQCSANTPKFTPTGMVQGIICTDPGLPANGSIEAYQMNSYANYLKTWETFNKWWGFTSYTPGSTCPPAGTNHLTSEGSTTWYDKYFPSRQGQVFECEWTGTGNNPSNPAIAWSFPADNAFIIAWGGDGTSFSTLQSWWTNNVTQISSPTPAPPSSSSSSWLPGRSADGHADGPDARRRSLPAPAALHHPGGLLRRDEGREDPGAELRDRGHDAAPGGLGT